MVDKPLLFVLDQGFPKPNLDVHALDASVEYRHLSDYAPELADRSTPDWLLYLELHQRGDCTGLVTRDLAQCRQPEEMVALTRTALTLVTWRKAIEDPVAEWGQLLAYMPQVRKHIANGPPRIFILPAPRLSTSEDRIVKADTIAHELAQEQRVSFPELRDSALKAMRAQLPTDAKQLQELLA